MITEDYCSYEVSKLLKEKGFNELCFRLIREDAEIVEAPNKAWNGMTKKQRADFYLCPTHQMACKWLRKVHNKHVQINYFQGAYQEFDYVVINTFNGKAYNEPVSFSTYEEAVEAALKYSLENLI